MYSFFYLRCVDGNDQVITQVGWFPRELDALGNAVERDLDDFIGVGKLHLPSVVRLRFEAYTMVSFWTVARRGEGTVHDVVPLKVSEKVPELLHLEKVLREGNDVLAVEPLSGTPAATTEEVAGVDLCVVQSDERGLEHRGVFEIVEHLFA